MIFDKTCKVAERALPRLKTILDKTRLFHFPGRAHEFLPKEFDDETIDFLAKEFILPFPHIAVEDNAGMVILIDSKKNSKGINQLRAYIDIVPFHTPTSEFGDASAHDEKTYEQLLKTNPQARKDIFVITAGEIEEVKFTTGKSFYAVGVMKRVVTVFVDEHKAEKMIMSDVSGVQLKLQYDQQMLDQHLRASLNNAMTALQEIMYANTPNKFIFQEKPSTQIKKQRGKIFRSHERPLYTILKPNEIRKILKVPNPSTGKGSPKGGHDRRAHPRTFHSDRFIHMKDKTIMIPATWVGPSEVVVGKRHYKVLLDK